MVHLASIVEGHGECEAVPILVRRIAQNLDAALAVSVHPVLRVPGSRLAKQGEIERTVELAARKNAGQPALTAIFDMNAARSADSFDKCYREIVRLLSLLRQRPAP